MQPLLLEPDFTYAVMKTKSAAAANLCNWVINIINFNQVRCLPPTRPSLVATEACVSKPCHCWPQYLAGLNDGYSEVPACSSCPSFLGHPSRR